MKNLKKCTKRKEEELGLFVRKDKYNGKFYYKDSEMTILHREDGPAIERLNGDKYWYLDDERHRIGGPAVEYAIGTKSWYVHGKLHRIDGPAIERRNGDNEWYINGLQHREDGPAFEGAYGTKSWYAYGLLHREDGPAIENEDGSVEWYINGTPISSEEFSLFKQQKHKERKTNVRTIR